MAFKDYDLVWYNGELEEYKNHIYSVVGLATSSDSVICIRENHPEDIFFDPALLSLIKENAPKYSVKDRPLYLDFEQDTITSCQVVAVYPSRFAQNGYSIRILRDNSTIEFYVLEETLIPDIELTDSAQTTYKHINQVAGYLSLFAIDLLHRGRYHDASKLSGIEKYLLDQLETVNTTEGNAPYGSPEYKKRTKILKPMLKLHYARNSHHPEHYENGVMGMNLADIIEMAVADWPAAAARNGDPVVGLTKSCERYGIDNQLKSIIANTYRVNNIKWE